MSVGVCPRCNCRSYETLKSYSHCFNCNYFFDPCSNLKSEKRLREAIELLKQSEKENKSPEPSEQPSAYLQALNPPFHALALLSLFIALVTAGNAFGSVESTLAVIQTRLITTILPLAAILGLVFAGLSFVAGSQNAKPRLIFAIMGAVIGFGAPSIMEFIRSMVH